MNPTKAFQQMIEFTLITLGIVVISGWYMESKALVQIHDSFFPMQYNTAFGFLFTGISLVCLRCDYRKFGVFASSLVLLIGFLTLTQYILGINLGIDTLFNTPTIGADPETPGRTGANTAFCFFLFGSLAIAVQLKLSRRSWIGMISLIIGVLAMASIWGYLSHMPGLSGWGSALSGMAIHTSVGFLLTAIALLLYGLRIPTTQNNPNPLLTSKTVVIPILTAALCVWQSMNAWEALKLRAFTSNSTRIVTNFLEHKLDEQIMGLERMGDRWNTNNATPFPIWQADVTNYLNDYSGLQSIGWIDRTHHVRWMIPETENGSDIGVYRNMEKAKGVAQYGSDPETSIRISPTLELPQGGLGFLVYIPVTTDAQSDGFLLAMFRADKFLENAFQLNLFQHDITILDDERVIYTTATTQTTEYQRVTDPIRIAGLNWKAELSPTPELIRARTNAWPEAILFIGILVAAAVSQLLHLLQSNIRARIKQQDRLLVDLEIQKQHTEEVNRDLRRSNAEMEEFTYTVSHDLKTPLVTIHGYAGFLKQDIQSGRHDRAEDFVDRINGATDRMNAIISGLLELSKVGQMKHRFEIVRTQELIEEVVEQLDPIISGANAHVIVQSDIPDTWSDRVRTAQVFQNLITNAIKYARVDGKDLEIRIGASMQGEMVRFSVADNGPGIDPLYHSKIFGLFQRLESEAEGNGIGLSIVNRIASLHGGEAWVESTLGSGATFFITLPSAEVDSTHQIEHQPVQCTAGSL